MADFGGVLWLWFAQKLLAVLVDQLQYRQNGVVLLIGNKLKQFAGLHHQGIELAQNRGQI